MTKVDRRHFELDDSSLIHFKKELESTVIIECNKNRTGQEGGGEKTCAVGLKETVKHFHM